MGTVANRNGVLYFDFRYRGQRCRESASLADTPSNRRRCEAALKRMEAEITLGSFDYAAYFPDSERVGRLAEVEGRRQAKLAGVPTFAAFAELWFAEKAVEWRRSYADTVRISLDNQLLPTFGPRLISTLTKAEILAFRAGLTRLPGRGGATHLSTSRINHIMTPLRMILTEASDRHGFETPWRNISPLKEPRTQVDPLSLNQVNAFLGRVRPDMRDYYVTRFFTGLRSSEVDGLLWKYVDFNRRQILVREALVNGRMERTKTDGSEREIAMNSLVLDALQRQHDATGKLGGYVFCSRKGNPFINRNVTNRVWYPTLSSLGLTPRRPYQTRHTAATLWLASGENPEWIARQMGHTTTEMLFRIYSRYVPNLTRKDGSAFERLLQASLNPEPLKPETD